MLCLALTRYDLTAYSVMDSYKNSTSPLQCLILPFVIVPQLRELKSWLTVTRFQTLSISHIQNTFTSCCTHSATDLKTWIKSNNEITKVRPNAGHITPRTGKRVVVMQQL